ncbi:MAG: ATP-binding protein [Chloroflexi bacterium]|nr:ATP-binding protein [Chloroflexota bacterium]
MVYNPDMALNPLPVGIQTFRKIIEGGYLYVDKTRYIYELIRHPFGVYFLSRPRRFGKSLLISTLDEIFQGNRDLFEGLWLYDSPYQWEQHPVIRIDFSENPVKNAVELKETLTRITQDIAHRHQITLRKGPPHLHFADLIRELAQQNQVVVLIDEYDKPILDNIENTEEAQRIRDVLKGFYGVIKALDAHIRFVLLTGVSKFSRVGVFSDLNNLNDLTMDNQYAAMLGITQEEVETNFPDYLHAFAETQGTTSKALRAQIQAWYDGFCFSRRCEPVYNPFSLLLLFQKREFQNYWFESGTPTFLIKLLKTRGYDLQQLEDLQVPELAFSTYEIESLEIVPLLFQTGYLTIKDYEDRFQTYTLSYPNYEVKRAFMAYLLNAYGEVELAFAGSALKQLAQALLDTAWGRFFQALNTFLANIPYDLQIKQEKYYQTIFYLIFKLIGLEINAEVHTNQGRIDAVIETEAAVYLFEFKLDGSAAEALQQIKEREYFARYQLTEKTLHLLGVSFEMEKRRVAAWEAS